MLKKVMPFIIALPALTLIFIFKIIPAFYTWVLSFKDYKIINGISGSPWVGMRNYEAIFQSVIFIRIAKNTLVLNFLSIIITVIFATALTVCVSKLPNRWFKLCAIAILAIPAFIPVSSLSGAFFNALSVDSGFINKLIIASGKEPVMFFANKEIFPLLFALMDSMRSVFIPVIIGVLVCEYKDRTCFESIAIVMAGYVAAKATMLLSPEIELLHLTINPLVYETADVFDTYSYRTGLLSSQFASSSAVWIIKASIQMIINIVLYFILAALVPRIAKSVKEIGNKINRAADSIVAAIGFILIASGSITVIILTFIPVSGNISEGMRLLMANKQFVAAVFNSLVYSIFGSIFYGFIAVTLSYPMTVRTRIYPFILIIAMSLVNNFTGEYLIYRSMGSINTIIPVILGSGLSVMGAFAIYFSISDRFGDEVPEFSRYLKAAALPLVTIVMLSFIANWGGYIHQLVYLSNPNLRGIGLLGVELFRQPNAIQAAIASPIKPENIEDVKAAFCFISSIIPAAMGTVLIFLSKRLPLSAFVSQIRKG